MKKVPVSVGATIIAVALVPWVALWSSLPDPVASHFDLHGRADGHLSPLFLMIALGGVATVLAVSAVLSARDVAVLPRPVSGGPVLAFVAGLLAVVSLGSVLANRDAASWESARLSLVWIVVAVAFGAVTGAAIAVAQPAGLAGHRAPSDDRPAVQVGPTERLAWVGRSSARFIVVLAAALALGGLIQVFTVSPPIGEIVLLSAAAVGVFSSLQVVVSGRGVRVSGPFGWPRDAPARPHRVGRRHRRQSTAMGWLGLPRLAPADAPRRVGAAPRSGTEARPARRQGLRRDRRRRRRSGGGRERAARYVDVTLKPRASATGIWRGSNVQKVTGFGSRSAAARWMASTVRTGCVRPISAARSRHT